MKIVMLNGQNHNGSTYHIGRMIADKIEGENEITEFFFPKDLNHFCAGCYQCIEDVSACPYYEEKKKIIETIDAADILIVTTPTYCMHMSAPLKSFFDLTFDLWIAHSLNCHTIFVNLRNTQVEQTVFNIFHRRLNPCPCSCRYNNSLLLKHRFHRSMSHPQIKCEIKK